MVRGFSTDTNGYGYPESTIQAIWEKGRIDQKYDSKVYRQDVCNNWMKRELYGKQVQYGWEIDHIIPLTKGGKDDISNMQPMYWEANRKKGDTYPWNTGMC